MHRVVAAFGLLIMILLAWLLSSARGRFPWRVVLGGLGLQISFALLILGTRIGAIVFSALGEFFTGLLSFVDAGCQFVFGDRFQEFYFAFRVLPTIIFFSSLMSILFHLGVVQLVVRAMGRVMQVTLRTSGAESLASAANVFVGQTEAPLVILPYLPKMTRSELMAVMVGGFSTVAGGVMAAYVGMGIDAGHLITASVISAPASLLIAKVLLPELEMPETMGGQGASRKSETSNLIEAATVGASAGLKLALNVGAMMIAFLALIAMLDFGISFVSVRVQMLGGVVSPVPWTFSGICGVLFSPLAWLMGIEWKDCAAGGQLLGMKMVANEFLAYMKITEWDNVRQQLLPLQLQLGLTQIPSGFAAISHLPLIEATSGLPQLQPRSVVILTYALCGFSNFASIGIQVGGIGGLVPERRRELSELGFRAMLGGTLACCMTACIAGIVIG